MLIDENDEIKYFRRSTSSSESKMDKIFDKFDKFLINLMKY